MNSTLLIVGVCRTRVTYQPSKMAQLTTSWLERPTGIWEAVGSIPVGDSEFFFVPCSSHVEHFIFIIYYQAENLPSLQFTFFIIYSPWYFPFKFKNIHFHYISLLTPISLLSLATIFLPQLN